jgi:ribonuclease D
MSIANQQPDSLDALSELDIWHPTAVQRHGRTLLAYIDQILQSGLTARPPDMLLAEHRKLLADMKKLVQEKATELSVEPALLASKRELESLILTPPGESLPERFLGWRKDIITNGLMALKDDFS